MNNPVVIRASSLSSYADCPRRGAARALWGEIIEAGYDLRHTPNNIGAIVGTAMHAGAHYSMLEKMNTGEIGNQAEAEQRSLESLKTGLEEGEVLLDVATKNINEAEQQTVSLVRALRYGIISQITPVEVEKRLEAKVSDNITLSGQVDVNLEDGIVDWKSGTQRRANGPQYGAYLLLGRSHGYSALKATEYYVKRVRPDKPQPEPERHPYDGAVVENQALAVIKGFERDMLRFRETGDRFEFLSNPSSMLCSPKYCPAFGTSFCKEHKKTEE